LQHKKLLKTLKVAKTLPSTIYTGLVVVYDDDDDDDGGGGGGDDDDDDVVVCCHCGCCQA